MMILDNFNTAGQRKGRNVQRQQERRSWLMTWPILQMLPSDREDVTAEGRSSLDLTVTAMRGAWLYSPSTSNEDCRDGIRKLVGEMRRKGQQP
jgi:hypothetical protein